MKFRASNFWLGLNCVISIRKRVLDHGLKLSFLGLRPGLKGLRIEESAPV